MDPAEQYRVALSSPTMVSRKDRSGWLGLFATDGFVEDPVEAGRYEGPEQRETFWDVFIGPQPSVRFDIARDFWAGDVLIRQATVVSVTQADPNTTLDVPALICYTQRDDRLASLQALWEPRNVVNWFFGRGVRGLWALSRHGVRMTAKAGLGNGLSFGKTVMGGLDPADAQALVQTLCNDDADNWSKTDPNEMFVGCEDSVCRTSDAINAHSFLRGQSDTLGALRIDQLLVCGSHIAAFASAPGKPGALALMIRTRSAKTIESLTAIWSRTPRVLPNYEGT